MVGWPYKGHQIKDGGGQVQCDVSDRNAIPLCLWLVAFESLKAHEQCKCANTQELRLQMEKKKQKLVHLARSLIRGRNVFC